LFIEKQLLISSPPCVHSDNVVVVVVVVWMDKERGCLTNFNIQYTQSHTNLTSRHALSSCLDRIVTEVSVDDAPLSRSRNRYTDVVESMIRSTAIERRYRRSKLSWMKRNLERARLDVLVISRYSQGV
jgi:hypothetical protein